MATKHVIAVISDLHCGSSIGLCGPSPIDLDDGGTYTYSKYQKWLWVRWEKFCERVRIAREGAHLTLLCNGDMVDGPEHHRTVQNVSRHPGVQFQILTDCIKPLLALNPDHAVVVRGTEVHVGASGAVEESFARWLKDQGVAVLADEKRRTWSQWKFTGDYHHIRVDAAHHGKMGRKPWTQVGLVANYAVEMVYHYASSGRRWPDIAIRSHYHKLVDTYDNHPVRIIQTPAWQLATAFIYRIAPDNLADIGGVIITIEKDKEPQVEKVTFKPTEGAVWRAPT